MPKLKTNKAAKKRYSYTATGKVKRTKANKRHLLANKTSRAKDLKDCYCHLQNSIFLIYLCKTRMEPSLRTQVVHSVTLPTGKV